MNNPFTTHTGFIFSLPKDNVDTDQIIPSREIKAVSKENLGKGLFANWRYLEITGYAPNPDFALNTAPTDKASILIAGKNFGCGSSREHAVWALKDFGFRCIIARSFGDIFYNNCIRNCLLPIALDKPKMKALGLLINQPDLFEKLEVCLGDQTIRLLDNRDSTISFEIEETDKHMLLNGLDPIGLTEQHCAEIQAYLKADQTRRPWAYPETKNNR